MVCLGSDEGGDDALGLRLGERLARRGVPDVIMAGTQPESVLRRDISRVFDHLVFLDAVHFGGGAGDAVWLDSTEMAARFPQVSTHRLCLGLLAKLVEAEGTTRAWLLGVEPASLVPAATLSPRVGATLAVVEDLLASHLGAGATA